MFPTKRCVGPLSDCFTQKFLGSFPLLFSFVFEYFSEPHASHSRQPVFTWRSGSCVSLNNCPAIDCLPLISSPPPPACTILGRRGSNTEVAGDPSLRPPALEARMHRSLAFSAPPSLPATDCSFPDCSPGTCTGVVGPVGAACQTPCRARLGGLQTALPALFIAANCCKMAESKQQFIDLNPDLLIPFGQLARVFPAKYVTPETCSASFRALAKGHSVSVRFAAALAANFFLICLRSRHPYS